MCLPKIFCPVFMFAFIFSLLLVFTFPAASISHFLTAAISSSCFFFQRNLSPFFKSLALASFLCYPRVSVNIKNNVEKDPTLLLFFLSMAMAIFLPN